MAICYLFIMLYTLHRNNYFFYTLWKLILSSWYTLFETLCFAVCRKKDWPYTYWGEGEGMRSRTVSSSIHYSPRRPDSGTTKRREFPSRRHLRYFGISRYIYGTRTRESLVNLSHNSEYLTNTSPPPTSGEHKGKFSQARKKFIQTRCGQRDFKTFSRRRARKLVGYTATPVATELFVVYCNKLWWTAEPASLM